MSRSTITIDFNRFPEIAARLPIETSAVVRKNAFDLEAHAKQFAPVDTGTLKNSIQTEILPGDLTATVSAGNETTPYGKTRKTGETSTSTTPSVEYAMFVEFGRAYWVWGAVLEGSFAQPYMTPAAEIVRPQFRAAMKQLLTRLA